MKRVLCLLFAFYFGCSLSGLENERARALARSLPGFFGPQTRLTDPVPVARMLAEWEPASSVLLSIPMDFSVEDEGIFEFYASIIEAASLYVDVSILFGPTRRFGVEQFKDRLNRRGMGRERLARVHFLPAQVDSFWVRDFGPLFGKSRSGDRLIFDNIYRSLGNEREVWEDAPSDIDSAAGLADEDDFLAYSLSNRACEVAPRSVARHLTAQHGFEVLAVRPPLYLQGGDYITDSSGTVFVSEDTLLQNGGRLEDFEGVLSDYLGAEKVVLLNALPGLSVKHLDLLVCHPNPDTFLLSKPFGPQGGGLYYQRLRNEIEEIQLTNERILRANNPDVRIEYLPMPPILQETPGRILDKAAAQIFAILSESIGVNMVLFQQLDPYSPEKRRVYERIDGITLREFGRVLNWKEEADISLMATRYLGADLETLIETNVLVGVEYRSYANGLQIVTEAAGKVWLLPRFLARDGEDQTLFDRMEKEVEAVYLRADPGSTIHWIDSDRMVSHLGTIHCVAMTLPAF